MQTVSRLALLALAICGLLAACSAAQDAAAQNGGGTTDNGGGATDNGGGATDNGGGTTGGGGGATDNGGGTTDNGGGGATGNGGGGQATLANLGVGASLNGVRPFPADNPWNMPVDQLPIDPNSDNLIASIGLTRNLHPDFGTVWQGAPIGIPYVVVPGDQPKVPVTFEYADESDAGPYPIPDNPPIEGGPNGDGDRHIIMLDRDTLTLYELFAARFENGGWRAGSGAIFNLRSNALRPLYWTSADAAGLPIFPGLVRYDEVVERGEIRHALRFTVRRSRRAFVPPARHWASTSNDPNLPPMGMRVRLKASYVIPANFSAEARVILQCLKTYGMIVADNGSDWFISGAPDSRWNDDNLRMLKQVPGSQFEVVRMDGLVTP